MRVPNNAMNNMGTRNQNPYRIPTIPSPRPAFDAPRTLPGFYITSEDDIAPGDVPMDGSISFFPAKDLSSILIRQWDSNGNLESCYYIPKTSSNQEQTSSQSHQPVNQAEESALVTALNSLNQGLSSTFNQFGLTLQSVQQRLDAIDQRFNKVSTSARSEEGIG